MPREKIFVTVPTDQSSDPRIDLGLGLPSSFSGSKDYHNLGHEPVGSDLIMNLVPRYSLLNVRTVGLPEKFSLDIAVAAALVQLTVVGMSPNQVLLALIRSRICLGPVVETEETPLYEDLCAVLCASYTSDGNMSTQERIELIGKLLAGTAERQLKKKLAFTHGQAFLQVYDSLQEPRHYYDPQDSQDPSDLQLITVISPSSLAAHAVLHEGVKIGLAFNPIKTRYTITWDSPYTCPIEDVTALLQDLCKLTGQEWKLYDNTVISPVDYQVAVELVVEVVLLNLK
jgi:hypothetical protein